MQTKWIVRVVMTLRAHIKNFQTILISFYEVVRFCITLLTPHGGRHSACCVTSYGLHLSATPLWRPHVRLIGQLRAGSQEYAS